MIKPLTEPSELDALAETEPVLAATAASSVAAFRGEPGRLSCFGEYDETGALVAAADLTSRDILLLCERSGLSDEMLDFLKKMAPAGEFAGIRCGGRALPALKRHFTFCEYREPAMACSSLPLHPLRIFTPNRHRAFPTSGRFWPGRTGSPARRMPCSKRMPFLASGERRLRRAQALPRRLLRSFTPNRRGVFPTSGRFWPRRTGNSPRGTRRRGCCGSRAARAGGRPPFG